MPMSKNMLDGGQVIVDYLVREKVPYVFGLCGHGNIGFLDALYERADDIKTISSRNEPRWRAKPRSSGTPISSRNNSEDQHPCPRTCSTAVR